MPERELFIAIDEFILRRLAARAAERGGTLDDVVRRELLVWLGDWGLRFGSCVVQPGETLETIAQRFYGDPRYARMLAAYNGFHEEQRALDGETIYLPEVDTLAPLPAGESPYLFGVCDRGGEHFMAWAGRPGWVVCRETLGADPEDRRGRSYADLAQQGYGVIVGLSYGEGTLGTLPPAALDESFAVRCGNFAEASPGCHIWVIGNEPNRAGERHGGPEHGEPVTPARYAAIYRACRREIRRRLGHTSDQVVLAAGAPWCTDTAYPGNPTGDWITYFQDVLRLLGDEEDAGPDAIALHTYGRDSDPAGIRDDRRMDAPYAHRRMFFRGYIDYMQAIPPELRHVPVYITETDQNQPWLDANHGWVQAAYAEIDQWNANPANQPIRCLALYRWDDRDPWSICGRRGVLDDLRQALQHDYRWYG